MTDAHVPEASHAPDGVAWDAFAASAPELAEAARALLRRGDIDEGLLATVRGDALPRINPVYVGFIDGHLLTVALAASAKLRDLREDGRFALHSHQDPAAPSELLLRGRGVDVDGALRAAAAAAWPFAIDDGVVFELRIEQVTLGERPDADAWPPVYRSWRASA